MIQRGMYLYVHGFCNVSVEISESASHCQCSTHAKVTYLSSIIRQVRCILNAIGFLLIFLESLEAYLQSPSLSPLLCWGPWISNMGFHSFPSYVFIFLVFYKVSKKKALRIIKISILKWVIKLKIILTCRTYMFTALVGLLSTLFLKGEWQYPK